MVDSITAASLRAGMRMETDAGADFEADKRMGVDFRRGKVRVLRMVMNEMRISKTKSKITKNENGLCSVQSSSGIAFAIRNSPAPAKRFENRTYAFAPANGSKIKRRQRPSS